MPCIFYPDLYGASYTDDKDGEHRSVDMPAIGCLPALVDARKRFANGPQTDLFDDPHVIGFIRHGTADLPGCVVVMSNGEGGEKVAELGGDQAGKTYVDILGHPQAQIVVGDDGKAAFPTNGGSVSVWVDNGSL